MARKTDPTVIDGEVTDIPDSGEALQGEVQDGEKTIDDVLHHAFVEFQGRQIEVRAPDFEQIVIIRRLQKVFSDAAAMKTIEAEKALKLMDRALLAATSVTVHPEDVEFIEDLWLDRKIKMEATLPLLTAAMKALEAANSDQTNREQRRAAGRKSSSRTGKATLVTG